ncbi:MAG TPA: protease pro-enzyme activation domain-containing protein [Steroidobacteraceae bacterium]|jgi:subtilase family serine protease|nr:protease pro-enzyme activation domain-containing protein [Steroidobacteraceae bacterium]
MKHSTGGRWSGAASRASFLGLLITCGAWLLGPSHPAVSQPLQTAGSATVRLPGHVSRFARPEDDVGEAAASLRMSLQLVLTKTPAQEQALQQLIADQQNMRSTQFHHWLTPAQFGARFGASDSTMATLSGWLKSQGLKPGAIPAGHTFLPFSGTRAQVEAAFATPIHAFNINGEQHYSNVAEPSIPAGFNSVIAAIRGLNDFYPRAGIHTSTPMSRARSSPPDLYEGALGAYSYLIPGFVVPADAANIYDMTRLYADNITGKGVTVAVVAESDISATQLTAYLTAVGVTPTGTFSSIPVPTVDGGSDPGQTKDGNEDEAYLDTEIISALAPGANVLLVRDKNAGLTAQYIIDEDTAGGATSGVGVMNISFSTCEAADAAPISTSINSAFQQAATEGITVTVSTGDVGANQVGAASTAGCMSGTDEGQQGDVASKGLAVNALASTPYTLSVGGTDFDPNLEGAAGGPNWSMSNAVPGLYSTTAHVPEMVWNTSCGNPEWSTYFAAASPLALCNMSQLTTVDFGTVNNPFIEVLAGGGGVSSCTSVNTAGACTGGNAQPAWQQNVAGISNFGGRAVPDVSAIANRWVICSYKDTPCTPASGLPSGFFRDGTSASAPVMASIMALLDQSQQAAASKYSDGRQGLINPLLYQIAAIEYGSAANLSACNASQGAISNAVCVFYDVTLGSNAAPCTVASFSDTGSAPASACDNAGNGAYTIGLMTAASAAGTGSYPAGAGYDLATGLGSVDAANLIAAVAGLAPPNGLSATASLNSAAVTLKWSADAGAGTFNVYQGTAPGKEGATPVQTASGTTATISGLQNGQTYYFEIAGLSVFGTSPDSNEASATTIPAVPAGLSASAGNAMVTLSWGASSGATSYNVYQSTSASTIGPGLAPVQTPSTTSTTLTGLTNGTTYYFAVQAVDAGGASAMSNMASAAPMAPGGGGGGGGSLDWLTLVGLAALRCRRQRR